jgi:Uma2 family endonuclease
MSAIAMPAPAAATPPTVGPRPVRYTVEQYEKMCAAGFFLEQQYELIHGEIIDMGKEGPRHYAAFLLALDVIRAAFGPGFVARPTGPITTPNSMPQPDVSIVPGSPRLYLAGHPTTALFALEISETTLSYDLTTKAELYATAGIPEYWVLDLNGRQLHVFRDPAPLPLPTELAVTAYGTHLTYAPGDSVQPLHAPGTVAVADLLP